MRKKGMTRTELSVPENFFSGTDVSEEYTRNIHLENENIFGIVSKCLFPQGINKSLDMIQEGRQGFHFYP
jgi:hypothetical protein